MVKSRPVQFSALVCYEGSKRGPGASLRITVPAELRNLRSDFTAPGWVRLTVNGCEPFFAYARRPQSRSSVDITLPHWRLPALKQGDTVVVTAEDAASFAATTIDHRNDWVRFVPREFYFPVEDEKTLSLWNQHSEPFSLSRIPSDSDLHWWLLGFYQAEGSKSSTAADFSAANTLPQLLKWMIRALTSWGISRDRMYMGVLHRIGTEPDAAVELFKPLGVDITYVRATAKNDKTGLLHVYQSMPLMRIVRERLHVLFEDGFSSTSEALSYALGWLDGDGSIIHRGISAFELVLAGGEAEHVVMKHALQTAFGWSFTATSYYRNTDDGTRITLHPRELLDLLDARAFSCSMNRVRLLLAFGARTETVRQRAKLGAEILRGRERYEHAIVLARMLKETRPDLFKQKCVPYPAEMKEW